MDIVIFVPDIIDYAFVGVFLSDATFMGGEYSNESRGSTNICSCQITLNNTQKSMSESRWLICIALDRLRWSLWKRSSLGT